MGKLAAAFIALVAFTSLLCYAQTPAPRPFGAGFYDVVLDLTEPLQATVRAMVSVTDGQLFTSSHAGSYQWSSHIKDLRVYSNEGGEIPLTFVAPNRWRFPTLTNQTVQVRYNVDLSFTTPRREGSQDRGRRLGGALYVVNQALFVMSDASGERTVHFIVPASFRISSPLTQIAPSTYTAPGNTELTSKSTSFTQIPLVRATDGAFQLSFTRPASRATASPTTYKPAPFKSCSSGESHRQRASDGCTRLDRIGW